MNGENLIEHLVVDYLWKVGIVVASVLVVIVALIVIYRKLGSKR